MAQSAPPAKQREGILARSAVASRSSARVELSARFSLASSRGEEAFSPFPDEEKYIKGDNAFA